jgi:hypothetical protein
MGARRLNGKVHRRPERAAIAIIKFKRKTGAGEGIRTLDPNLGKIRLYEILSLFQIVVWLLGNPNTIRTFSTQFAQSGFCAMFWRKPPH